MNESYLAHIAESLVAVPKGILAIDESTETCTKRFEARGVESTEEMRRQYRELLVTTPDIGSYTSGFILYDETLRQSNKDGKRFVDILRDAGVQTGIKVDLGTEPFVGHDGEVVTKGLSGLTDRLIEYKNLGATFTKWRAVIHIGDGIPTEESLKENAERLAEYAYHAQEAGLVPMVEPEVLMDGNHALETAETVTAHTLEILFKELRTRGVYLPGMILKTSMVVAGSETDSASPAAVADATLRVLRATVPEEVAGVVFLSGGQDPETATLNLREIHKQKGNAPWPITFSFGRAIQEPTLDLWAADPVQNWDAAQEALRARLASNSSVLAS